MLNLARIRILQAVADTGSIVAAAEQLQYTPSAVSQQVQTLERELRVHLVVRGARGSTLTPAGAELAARGRGLLAHADAAIVATQETASIRGGLLRISTFPSAGATLLPKAFAALRGRQPSLEIRLLEREPLETARLVERGEVDVAVTFTYSGLPGLDLPSGLVATLIREERMLVALPAGFAAPDRRITLGEIELDWIDNRDWGPRLRLLAFLAAREGVNARIAFETDDYQIALALVASGLGVAIVPESVATGEWNVQLRELESEPRREIIAITQGAPAGSAHALVSLMCASA